MGQWQVVCKAPSWLPPLSVSLLRPPFTPDRSWDHHPKKPLPGKSLTPDLVLRESNQDRPPIKSSENIHRKRDTISHSYMSMMGNLRMTDPKGKPYFTLIAAGVSVIWGTTPGPRSGHLSFSQPLEAMWATHCSC